MYWSSGGSWLLVRVWAPAIFEQIFLNFCAFARKWTKICEKKTVARTLTSGHGPPLATWLHIGQGWYPRFFFSKLYLVEGLQNFKIWCYNRPILIFVKTSTIIYSQSSVEVRRTSNDELLARYFGDTNIKSGNPAGNKLITHARQ